MNRRDFLKLAGIGTLTIPFLKRKKKNNMTIQIDGSSSCLYTTAAAEATWGYTASGVSLPYPGVVVGVSIFGSATVTYVITEDVDVQQYFTFVRADTNGIYRSEIWYLPNISIISGDAPVDTFGIKVALSSSADIATGLCLYKYFGGVGANEGATGTGEPIEVVIDTTRINSITFANLCVSTAGVLAPQPPQNERWRIFSGNNNGFGSDEGPIESIQSMQMLFQNAGALEVWAESTVELLDYQDNPPAIMGM